VSYKRTKTTKANQETIQNQNEKFHRGIENIRKNKTNSAVKAHNG
jgi:hypothetical protein